MAFSDANSLWEPDALRPHPQPRGRRRGLRLRTGGRQRSRSGDSRENLLALELWLREQESACGSVTAGNGGIYAVRRSAFLELGPEHSHDLGLPFRLRRRGSVPSTSRRRPFASPRSDDPPRERRKVRMLSRAWWEVLRGGRSTPAASRRSTSRPRVASRPPLRGRPAARSALPREPPARPRDEAARSCSRSSASERSRSRAVAVPELPSPARPGTTR